MFTSLTNPGLILPSKETSETNKSIGMLCSYCNAIKIKRSYHCKECDACIKDWDHHCVWTGKCIGEGNINYFWAFLACTAFFLSYHSAITLGVYKEL